MIKVSGVLVLWCDLRTPETLINASRVVAGVGGGMLVGGGKLVATVKDVDGDIIGLIQPR